MSVATGVRLLRETFAAFQEDEAEQLGAALAYYAAFSLFPLLLLLLAALGFILGDAASVEQEIIAFVATNFSPQFGERVAGLLDAMRDQAAAATGIGLATLLLGASGVFQQLDRSFNAIWGVERRADGGWRDTLKATVSQKLLAFAMVLGVGLLLLVSVVATALLSAALALIPDIPLFGRVVGGLAGLALTLALNTLMFALLFKHLPKVPVRWGDALMGALLSALLWELAKRLLALYIERSAFSSAYGAVGTMLALLAWIYFSSQVLFFGAEFSKVYAAHRQREMGAHAGPGRAAGTSAKRSS